MNKISKNLAEHLVYWTGIQNGTECNADGALPTVPERIKAGSCIITVFAILDNNQAVDENAIIAAASESLGEKWPGPAQNTGKALERLKGAFYVAG